MELAELLALITDAWPRRYERGLVTHIHRNALTLADGSQVHLRVLIQRLREVEPYGEEEDTQRETAADVAERASVARR